MNHFRTLIAIVALLSPSAGAHTLRQQDCLTLDGAKAAAGAAARFLRERGAGGAIAVVDPGGHLLYLERLDGTFAAAAEVATGKARTAALFQKPTALFEKLIRDGRTPMVALDPDFDFTPLQGGVPILAEGTVVGALGVSGAKSAEQDEEAAVAGAAVLDGAACCKPAVQYFERRAVDDSFAKGAPLLETGGFKIHTSRRDRAGEAEVHEHETDILYVRDGTAELVTGGSVAEGRTVGDGEIRGASIDGGDVRRLGPGDVVVVPAGVPHWFRSVGGPVHYYVVKVAKEG